MGGRRWIGDGDAQGVKRRVVMLLMAIAIAVLGLSAGLGLGGSTPAKAMNIQSSKYAHLISGYIMQDISGGATHGQQKSTRAAKTTSGVPGPSENTFGCSQHSGNNVRVNQDCTNQTVPRYAGRGQAQNETSIAVNPTNSKNVVGSQNDYRRGDGSCGADFSLDGGKSWGSGLLPIGFSVPGVDQPSTARHYWTSSGDPAVAFDSSGAAYYSCGVFDRAQPSADNAACSNPAGACASGIFVFRSVDGGASWNFPAGSNGAGGTGQVIVTPGVTSSNQFALEDKPYMAIDANPSSAFRDRIYETWTHYSPCGAANSGCVSANIYFAYSNNHGFSFSTPKAISGSSASLCTVGNATANACDQNQFSNPVVGADGSLYVFFANFNNAVTGSDNFNNILMVKSTDGGATFGAPVLVSQYYDLPDCYTYTGDDPGRACVPTAPASNVSVFRAVNYPSGAADPTNANKIYVTFGSYINPDSNPSNAAGHGQCAPNGFSPFGTNDYTGVGTVNGCNNDILMSTSSDGGATWTGQTTPPASGTVVSNESGQLSDQFWQWASTTPSGQLAVSYYDRQYNGDENNGSNDVTLAAWHPSGFAHTRVTNIDIPPFTEFPDASNGYSVFAGDYTGLAVTSSAAYPLWTDSRDNENFQCPSTSSPLGLCRVTNGSVPGFDEDVFSVFGQALP